MKKQLDIMKLESTMLRASDLIDAYDKHDINFTSKVKEWLFIIEQILKEAGMSQVSEIGSLRGSLISASRGFFDPLFNIDIKNGKRKSELALAMYSVTRCSEIIKKIIDPYLEERVKAKNLLVQILVVAAQNKLLDFYWKLSSNDKNNMEYVWQQLSLNENIQNGLHQVQAMVTYPYALIMMKQQLDSWEQLM